MLVAQAVEYATPAAVGKDCAAPRVAKDLHARQPTQDSALIHHSDRGSQYASIRYSERLAETGIEPSASEGGSYDNALAETINGLYQAELITVARHGKAGRPWNWPRSNG